MGGFKTFAVMPKHIQWPQSLLVVNLLILAGKCFLSWEPEWNVPYWEIHYCVSAVRGLQRNK